MWLKQLGAIWFVGNHGATGRVVVDQKKNERQH